jgi:hypothetical protein
MASTADRGSGSARRGLRLRESPAHAAISRPRRSAAAMRRDALSITLLAASVALAIAASVGHQGRSTAELGACVPAFAGTPGEDGWQGSGSAAAPAWLFSDGDHGNEARLPDPGNVRYEAVLSSSTFHVPARGADLEFRQRRAFSWANTVGVLEIAIGDRPFEDIAVAGATFESGAYDGRSLAANPLGFRAGWAAAPDIDTLTRITLPATASDRLVRLRFRAGSAGTGDALPGWGIYDIRCVLAE